MLLIRWLGQLSPPGNKPHPYEWYRARYGWIERNSIILFVIGGLSGLFLYENHLERSDPRGAAVAFVAGCLLSGVFVFVCIAFAKARSFREFWDFQEVHYGARSKFALIILLPNFFVALYFSLDLVFQWVLAAKLV